MTTRLDGPPLRRRMWPADGDFELAAMRRGGWSATPFSEFVVKVASRCNLRCDYCYVYEMADQGWRGQPKRMSVDTVLLLARRIREHALQWGLTQVVISFHGGEPLLVGAALLDEMATTLRAGIEPVAAVRFVCQTNGTLVTPDIAAVLAKHGVRVGVSIDGDALSNDRHRLYRDGSSSFHHVVKGIDILSQSGPDTFAGLLATIDLANDPLSVYRALTDLDPPQIDFLLPHGNWVTSPPGMGTPSDGSTPYADWLLAIFEEWYGESVHRHQIRLFEDVINLVLGGKNSFELLGLEPVRLLTIETDGSIELVDTLKSTYSGAAVTSAHLRDTALSQVLDHPGVVARQIGVDALADECRSCELVAICGGGMYTHRYSYDGGFRNPSVYCRDLAKLIGRIRDRVLCDLGPLMGSVS